MHMGPKINIRIKLTVIDQKVLEQVFPENSNKAPNFLKD